MKLKWYQVMYGQRYFHHGYVYVEAQNKPRAELVARQWLSEQGEFSRLAGCTVKQWEGDIPEGADTARETDYPQLERIGC